MDPLEKRCYKQNIDPSLKEVYRKSWATYYPLHVTHKISLPIVRLLLKTRVTPNHVTVLSCLSGLVAGLLFLTASSKIMLLLSAFFFEFYYVLDSVDGQLARARNVSSRGGGFFDEWGNFFVTPFVVCCIGLNFAPKIAFPWPILLASYAVLSIPLIEIVIDRWFPNRKKTGVQISETAPKKSNPLKLIYSLLYRSCTMPVVMNLTTLAVLLMWMGFEFPIHNLSPLGALTCYYATVGTAVWITKVMKVAWSE